MSLAGACLGGALLLGVLGILAVSGEHATGTIRATLAAEPRRPMVFAAKVLVFAAVILVIAEVTTFASFLLGQAFLTWPAGTPRCPVPGRCGPWPARAFSCAWSGSSPSVSRPWVRHTAGVIGAYVFVLLVLSAIVSALPGSIGNRLARCCHCRSAR